MSKTRSLKNFKEKFCGTYLGSGVSREVYVLKQNPRYVVKIDYTKDWHNITEWNVWREANIRYNQHLAAYLAPCVWISFNGKILIQKRIQFRHPSLYPQRIPNFLKDTKYANYGFYKNRLVCCDYSRADLFRDGRLRKVNWWPYSNDILGLKKGQTQKIGSKLVKYEQSSIKKGNKRKK